MDFQFNEEQSAVSDLATQILTDASTPEALKALEASGEPRFDRKLWATLAEAGLLGITIPEAHGGAGLGLVELGCILEAKGKTVAAVPLLETLGYGALPIAEYGSAELKAEWLPKVVAGEAVLTAAWHCDVGEPLDPTTKADERGGEWTVTGTKVPVPAAQIADGVVVTAKTYKGVALLFVDTKATGVSVTPVQTTAKSPDGIIEFEAAPATLLAEGDEELLWAYERALMAQNAVTLGVCASALRITAEFTSERKQFGVPIASFQAVGHRAADAYIDTEGIRLTTWQALWQLDAGMDASDKVAMAQDWAARGGFRVLHAAQHLHGGIGVDRDYPLHRYFLALKESELQLGGSSDALRRLGKQIAANA